MSVLGVLTATANRWCVFGKLNLRLVFEYFSSSTLPEGERPCPYFLRAFCLCALTRYFLVQNSYCVDLRMCMIAYELKRGNPVGFILVETLNGLDAFHRKEGSKLLCRKSSSPSGIIPNFCLGSQPSEIPLIFAWVAFWFSTHRGTLYCLSSLFYFFTLMLSFFSPLFFLLPPLFFFSPSYGYGKGFGYFNLPLYL